ncbi:MAG: hypothetical protein LC672_05165, partial [Acidobacteria bacterium]|nr:hypothetical protein [Acidobacteriota bacterium]
PAMPAGAFLIGELTDGSLAWRVRRLTQLAAGDMSARRRAVGLYAHGAWLWAGACALLLAALLVAADARVLAAIHAALEYAVKALR